MYTDTVPMGKQELESPRSRVDFQFNAIHKELDVLIDKISIITTDYNVGETAGTPEKNSHLDKELDILWNRLRNINNSIQ